MEFLTYGFRAILMFLICWLGLRIVGKKTIAQLTTYDLAGIFILTTIASEPLVFKTPSKVTEGVLIIALLTMMVAKLSLNRKFYNVDSSPNIVILNGKVLKENLKNCKMNLPLLLSELRIKGYYKLSEVQYGIIEPQGMLSVIPKSQDRPVQPKDLKIVTDQVELLIPFVIDGEIIYQNLKYAHKDVDWLNKELGKQGVKKMKDVFLAEFDNKGKLNVNLYLETSDININTPPLF